MNTKANQARPQTATEGDDAIDRFLSDNHEMIAAKLEAGRGEILRGEAAPLEPLETLLRDARARR
jgi:hypothetical protein